MSLLNINVVSNCALLKDPDKLFVKLNVGLGIVIGLNIVIELFLNQIHIPIYLIMTILNIANIIIPYVRRK